MALSKPGDSARLHIDSRTAAAFISGQGGTRSNALFQGTLLLWEQAVSGVSLLPPHWFPTKEFTAADFLSRLPFKTQNHSVGVHVGQECVLDHFSLQPTLDAFSCLCSVQFLGYIFWHRDKQTVAHDVLLSP